MDGIYSLWAEPKPDGIAALTDLETLLLAVSVSEWQRLHGRAHLYCDNAYAEYLEKKDLLALWDSVDTETISRANRHNVNAKVFWTLGRLLALGTVRVPFVSLDCDLVLWRSFMSEFVEGEMAVTHWEATNDSPWYPAPHELTMPSTYQFRPQRSWSLAASNASVIYFGRGTESVRDTYVEETLRFITGNNARVMPKLGVAPEILYADQRLLPIIANEAGVPLRALINATWSPAKSKFVSHDPRYGEWEPIGSKEQPAGITHGWFHKHFLASDDVAYSRLISELSMNLWAYHPPVAETLTRNGVLLNCQ